MSDVVKITKTKLDNLASAIRTKLGTEEELTLPEMIVDISELASPKVEVGENHFIIDFVDIPEALETPSKYSNVRYMQVITSENTSAYFSNIPGSSNVEVLANGTWRGYFSYGYIYDDVERFTGVDLLAIQIGFLDPSQDVAGRWDKRCIFEKGDAVFLKDDGVTYKYTSPCYVKLSLEGKRVYK